MKAQDFIADRLQACLPDGVPPAYREIVSASFEGSGANRKAVADLIMIDGHPATVEISTWGLMPQRYTSLPGGHLSFEDGRWQRINPETLEPFPAQGDFLATLTAPREGEERE
ncbi:hypothetical protein [Rhodobacter sp. 24-YEA-8]|uniref:hypothetical protein n=1 Tax=Rhodobacter sp. 24-YEA-8 TaxID=1884310 RepID=UPI000895C075|nr:hypothetical protein [Rhodobacter sp. 24-YEA-8]SEB78541.1 hypothetical protein SAMN05519105_1304 [Rhodobacter sp. 24-YEA-8]